MKISHVARWLLIGGIFTFAAYDHNGTVAFMGFVLTLVVIDDEKNGRNNNSH